MTVRRPLAVIVVLVALGACGGGGKDQGTKVTTDTAGPGVKNEGTAVSLKAFMKGTEEFPGPGVKDGTTASRRSAYSAATALAGTTTS